VSLLAYLPIEGSLGAQLQRFGIIAPGDVVRIVQQQLDAVASGGQRGLLTFAVAGAIWSSSSAMTAIISTLNRAFDVEEFRPFWQTRLVAIGLTLALAVFGVVALGIVLAGPRLGAWLLSWAGLGTAGATFWGRAVRGRSSPRPPRRGRRAAARGRRRAPRGPVRPGAAGSPRR
jgi:membrane protein